MAAKPANGSLYAPGTRSLFEDRKARYVGDILTIQLVERNTAQKSASTETERESATTAAVDLLGRISPVKLGNLGVDAKSTNDFEASAEASTSNQFNSTLTVSVIEVLPNGNLLVAGEKQMGINQGAEFIRFSGIVDPHTISRGNVVQSTQVADARIEYKGSGVADETQRMGWLQRFFLNVLPF